MPCTAATRTNPRHAVGPLRPGAGPPGTAATVEGSVAPARGKPVRIKPHQTEAPVTGAMSATRAAAAAAVARAHLSRPAAVLAAGLLLLFGSVLLIFNLLHSSCRSTLPTPGWSTCLAAVQLLLLVPTAALL